MTASNRPEPAPGVPETEEVESTERDSKGIRYIMNLVALYTIFFLSMVIIAWFGIFSEV
jgi:hypothetical protein